jgi:phosphatidylglycerophosphate synthase
MVDPVKKKPQGKQRILGKSSPQSSLRSPTHVKKQPQYEDNEENDVWVWKEGKWRIVRDEVGGAPGMRRFKDIWWFYANVIDYTRILMVIVAGFTITAGLHWTSAILIFVSILLDWVDGPVARSYNQCSILGSGADWVADVLGQVVTMAWWVQVSPQVLPWVLIVTCIETACCVFDFATTATLRYPKYPAKPKGGFFWILDLSMPENAYTDWGTILWLAYPIFSLACCLDASFPVKNWILELVLTYTIRISFIPTLMYAWTELAYLVHIMQHWSEPIHDVNVK